MTHDEDLDSAGAAPAWLRAVRQRLDFFAHDDTDALRATTTALHARAEEDAAAVLRAFLHACLDAFDDVVASRGDLRAAQTDLEALSALARSAIDGDRDDRPLLARARALDHLQGPAAFAASAPGRVVWLAAMAGTPGEEGAAATMVVNDLAALDPSLPMRALRTALQNAAVRSSCV